MSGRSDATGKRAAAPGSSSGGRPPPSERGSRRVTHRGVRWRRDAEGTVSWYNDGLGTWVRWRPRADAPPLPPGWADEGLARPPSWLARPRWRSPYRIVPIVLALVVIGLGVLQALRSSSGAARAERRAALALLDHCLARTGGTPARPSYGSTAVACTSPQAAVRVVAVLPGSARPPPCPAGTTALARPYPGVRYPHLACVRPLRR